MNLKFCPNYLLVAKLHMSRRNYRVSGEKKRQRIEKNLSISYRIRNKVCMFATLKKLSARNSLVMQW